VDLAVAVAGQGEEHRRPIGLAIGRAVDLGLVKTASALVRVHRGSAMFKLYILNHAEAFFGFYPIAEHAVTLRGEPVPMYDLMGKDATMFHHEPATTRHHSAASTSTRPKPGSTACGPPSAPSARPTKPMSSRHDELVPHQATFALPGLSGRHFPADADQELSPGSASESLPRPAAPSRPVVLDLGRGLTCTYAPQRAELTAPYSVDERVHLLAQIPSGEDKGFAIAQ
jgi:hypothetical protein